MTFTEAAEVVLRKVGKPLHYKKITQFAIEQNLLSHIGKTPEVTMSTRLATLTKKDRGDQNIQRVGPGIFGLREWGEVPAEALSEAVAAASVATDAAPAVEPTEGAAAPHDEAGEELLPSEPARPSPGPAIVPDEPEEPVAMSAEEVERNQRIEAAQEIFPEDDDDNEPVLGGGEKADPKGRRRRRRRRRGERDDGTLGVEGEDAPLAEGAAVAEGEERPRAPAALEGGDEAPVGEPPSVSARREEQPRRDSPRREEGRRDEGRRDEGRRDEGRRDRRGDDRRDEGRRDEGRRDDRVVEEGISGRDTADMIVAMLTRREDKQPVGLRALADESTRSGRIGGDPTNVIPMLAAAARMDGVRRAARGERARLRITGGRVGLVDWTLPPELLRAEADAIAALERLRDLSRRYVVRRLNELPQAAFTESVVLLLERLGISSLKVTRRSGLPQGEVHLTGVARRGPEESPVAVVIRRGGEIGRERVIDVRGSLHHYNGATAAWFITTGTVLSGAREEAAAAGATPVTLIDGVGFGRLLDEHGVCVSHATVGLPYLDVDLFDALRNA
ncbi:MAG: HTH domain-containing protein [Polyangiales bacterium]